MLASSISPRYALNKNEAQPRMELAQHQIYAQPAENDIIAGTERVKTWLHQKQMWFVEEKCPLTIKQMKSYRWAENTSPKDEQKRKEKVYKKDDELPDCIRYAVMTWPNLPKPVESSSSIRDITKLPGEMQAAIQRMRKIDNLPEKPQSVTGDFWGYDIGQEE
jgi:hypothetical protein